MPGMCYMHFECYNDPQSLKEQCCLSTSRGQARRMGQKRILQSYVMNVRRKISCPILQHSSCPSRLLLKITLGSVTVSLPGINTASQELR